MMQSLPLLDHERPHAFREQRVEPTIAQAAARGAVEAVQQRAQRSPGLQAWAVHLAFDRTRIMTVEAWRDASCYRQHAEARLPGSALYVWAATGGADPTPVTATAAGVIIIDVFRVWRPLVRVVAGFNVRNGKAFNREPGCLSTTVLRGRADGTIATYARWASEADFAAAFSKITGCKAQTAADVNVAAARMTMGFIRPDYHVYELVAAGGAAC